MIDSEVWQRGVKQRMKTVELFKYLEKEDRLLGEALSRADEQLDRYDVTQDLNEERMQVLHGELGKVRGQREAVSDVIKLSQMSVAEEIDAKHKAALRREACAQVEI